MASGNLLYNLGNSNWLCDNLEVVMGWEVEGRLKREETYVYLRTDPC